MPASFVFCVDAGATRSRGRVYSASGTVMASAEAGPANPSYDLGQAVASLAALWHSLAQQMGCGDGDLADVQLVVGGAGLYVPKVRDAFLARLPAFGKITLMSDGYAALVGASGGKPAALVTIGTGVAGHRLFADGTSIQRDALGWVVGDRGGGCWLGTRAVRHALEVWDGIAAPSLLSQAVMMQVGGAEGLLGGGLAGLNAQRLAAYAPLVFELAGGGCRVAAEILALAADYLARLIISLRCAEVPLYLNGGLSDAMKPFLLGKIARPIATAQGDALSGCLAVVQGKAPEERMVFTPAQPIGANP